MHTNEPLYTVYALTDGIVEDIYDGDSFDDAYDALSAAIETERAYKNDCTGSDDTYTETSVHLYEPHYGIMHAETTITGS